jgi:predicted mannosyl-3-phosphoglycerate phosphatase (HAD superfamily)
MSLSCGQDDPTNAWIIRATNLNSNVITISSISLDECQFMVNTEDSSGIYNQLPVTIEPGSNFWISVNSCDFGRIDEYSKDITLIIDNQPVHMVVSQSLNPKFISYEK